MGSLRVGSMFDEQQQGGVQNRTRGFWRMLALMVLAFILTTGVLSLSAKLMKPTIVGKWRSVLNSQNAVEFFADGTLSELTVSGSLKGKYKLTTGDRIKIEYEGFSPTSNGGTVKFWVTTDMLIIGPNEHGEFFHWTRMK